MLEASLILPLFIMVIFFFIFMVQMTLISTKVHTSAENLVRQVSSEIYPVYLALHTEDKSDGNPTNQQQAQKANARQLMSGLSMKEWANEYAAKLPYPLSDWVADAAEKGLEPVEELKLQVTEAALDPVMKPILQPYIEKSHLELERVHVTHMTIPDLRTGSTPYFGIELSYELPIRIPLLNRKVRISAKSEERLWIGDTDELGGQEGEAGDAGEDKTPVILQKPDPAYAGSRAAVKAKVEPNTSVTLTIYYKSGQSKAKYLGTAVADENGIVEWTWLVGGNTTPGIWQLLVETPEGSRTLSTFRVESPSGK